MNRIKKVSEIRSKLISGNFSIGSWIQIPNSSIAEILGQAGYDWVAVDLEHGSIDISQLPDIFRALEIGGTLPMVRLAQGHPKDCKQALDAGAAGLIIPMIESASQLRLIIEASCWPPAGKRGVGFSRANLYGKYFENYCKEAQTPMIVAMIENINALDELDEILQVKGLDAILIGPYDLSASMNLIGQFDSSRFIDSMGRIIKLCDKYNIPCGVHVVNPDPLILKQRINEGYRFLAYSIDSVFLNTIVKNPLSVE